jgi:glycine cleavage system H protein
MNFPADLKYTKNDEWVRVQGNVGTSGLSDYAQAQLSDIVYVELPAVGDSFSQGQAWGSVESVKAAAEVYLPVGGAITETNEALKEKPEVVNSDPYGQGWMVKFALTNPAELDSLMDAAAYQKYCEERQH